MIDGYKHRRNLPTANTRTKTLIGIPREVDVFIGTFNISLLTQNIGEHPERSLIIDSTLHITNGRFKQPIFLHFFVFQRTVNQIAIVGYDAIFMTPLLTHFQPFIIHLQSFIPFILTGKHHLFTHEIIFAMMWKDCKQSIPTCILTTKEILT